MKGKSNRISIYKLKRCSTMRKLTTLILLALIVIFAGCKNNNELYVGSVYGTIIDKATGKAIRNAGVELMSLGLKTVTGDDGQFEFAKVEEGKYNLFVTKSGYKDFKSNDIVVRSNNENKPVSIQIEKLPPSLTIVDDSENVIDAIDFSSDDGVVMKSFNIFNRRHIRYRNNRNCFCSTSCCS